MSDAPGAWAPFPERFGIISGPIDRTWIARRGSENWWPKQLPNADTLNWLDARSILGEDEVTYATVASQPSGDGELYALSFQVDGGIFQVELTAGQPGRLYQVFITATGRSGLTYPFIVNIEASAEGALSCPPPSPVPGPGAPLVWPPGAKMYGPVLNLPEATVFATGTTQQTATVVLALSDVLINAAQAVDAGVLTAIPAANYNGRQPVISNFSGVEIKYYPNTGDSFINQDVNAPIILVHTQSVTLRVSNSGALISF